jgi:hypothetical protein
MPQGGGLAPGGWLWQRAAYHRLVATTIGADCRTEEFPLGLAFLAGRTAGSSGTAAASPPYISACRMDMPDRSVTAFPPGFTWVHSKRASYHCL